MFGKTTRYMGASREPKAPSVEFKKGGTESVHSSDIFLWMDSLGSLGMRNQGAIVSFWLVISSPVLIELDPTH